MAAHDSKSAIQFQNGVGVGGGGRQSQRNVSTCPNLSELANNDTLSPGAFNMASLI